MNRISNNRIREVIIMASKIEKELISILMESPLYFFLDLKERYSLLIRLMKMRLENSQKTSQSKLLGSSYKKNTSQEADA